MIIVVFINKINVWNIDWLIYKILNFYWYIITTSLGNNNVSKLEKITEMLSFSPKLQ